jgi:DnaJ-class molecular chaperone
MNDNYYELLGVSPHCILDNIKKAYRRQAFKWHPDKNGGSKDCEEKFKQIQKAYETLSDPEKRKYYDEILAAEKAASASSESSSNNFYTEWVAPLFRMAAVLLVVFVVAGILINLFNNNSKS